MFGDSVPAVAEAVTVGTAQAPTGDFKAPYQVQVCNPQRQTDKSKSYVAYTVRVTKVRDGVESSSFRRFSDFLWIHDQLTKKHPACVVPPMPEKALTGNFSPELMMFRSRELTRFLQRVSGHPVLSADDDFEFFLMAPWDDFTARRNNTVKESFVGTLINSVTRIVTGGKVDDEDQWFVQLAADLGQRKKLLTDLQESAGFMVSGWRDLGRLYSTQAQQLQTLSKFFGDSEASHCGEDAQAMQADVSVLDEFANNVEHGYYENLRDYLREIAAIEGVLERRNDLIKEVANLRKQAEKKGAEAVTWYEDATRRLTAFTKDARIDIERILQTRTGELERIAISFTQMHRDCFTRTGSDWTNAVTACGFSEADEEPSADSLVSTAPVATTTTTSTTEASMPEGDSAGPFSSAVFDPSSPYATGDD